MRESAIERKCCALAKKHGWWHRKFKSPGKRSAPDRIFARPADVFFVEFKAPGKRPTELQAREIAEMHQAGLAVYVCDSVEEFRCVLESYGYSHQS